MFYRLSSSLTEENFFDIRDLFESGPSDYDTKQQLCRKLIKIGLEEFKPARHLDGRIRLANGKMFRHITLMLPMPHIDKIRDYAEKGYSGPWLVNRLLRIGVARMKGVSHVRPRLIRRHRNQPDGYVPPRTP